MASSEQWVYKEEMGTDDICSICGDWGNLPELGCEQCPNSYHKSCLKPIHHDANSWNICKDIGRECNLSPNGLKAFYPIGKPYKITEIINSNKMIFHYKSIFLDNEYYTIGDNIIQQNEMNQSYDISKIIDIFKHPNKAEFQFKGCYYLTKQYIDKKEKKGKRNKSKKYNKMDPNRILFLDESWKFEHNVDTIITKATLINHNQMDNIYFCDPNFKFDSLTKSIKSVVGNKYKKKKKKDLFENLRKNNKSLKNSIYKLMSSLTKLNNLKQQIDALNDQLTS